MTAIVLIALFISAVIAALVAFGYFRGPQIRSHGQEIWQKMPLGAQRVAKVFGHVVVFGLGTAFQYRFLMEHSGAQDWQFYYSLTVIILWAALTIKRIVKTLTSPDESFGSGTHA